MYLRIVTKFEFLAKNFAVVTCSSHFQCISLKKLKNLKVELTEVSNFIQAEGFFSECV